MAIGTGQITAFSGAIGDIPAGWVLCDGNNGTPNLQNRFIVGAGSGYAVGDNGGNINHNHTFSSGSHRHSIPAGTDIGSGVGSKDQTLYSNVVGTSDNTNGLPPYYALAFIMNT